MGEKRARSEPDSGRDGRTGWKPPGPYPAPAQQPALWPVLPLGQRFALPAEQLLNQCKKINIKQFLKEIKTKRQQMTVPKHFFT